MKTLFTFPNGVGFARGGPAFIGRCVGRLALIIAVCLTAAVCRAEENAPAAPAAAKEAQPGPSLPFDSRRLPLIKGTSTLLGAKLIDAEHKSVGRIDDLVLDLSSSRLIAVLVDSGGKNPISAVPAEIFQVMPGRQAKLNATRGVLESAPRFARGSFADSLDASQLAEPFRYFNEPFPKLLAAHLRLASGLQGKTLLSRTGQDVGRVQDIVGDLEEGRIVYLMIEPAAGPNPGADLYLVPPAAVRSDATGQFLLLQADLAHFMAGRHFSKDFPTEMNLPEMAVAVYQHYGLLQPATKPAMPHSTSDASAAAPKRTAETGVAE